MRFSHLGLLVVGLVVVGMSGDVRGAQDRAGGAAPAPTLPYKLVEWPAPATSAAGFAAPWNLIQVSSVAVTAKGTVLVLHRGAHPILEFDSGGKLIRSWGDGMFSEGKVAGTPTDKLGAGPVTLLCRRMVQPGARRAARTRCGSIRQGNIWVVDATGHVDLQGEPGW